MITAQEQVKKISKALKKYDKINQPEWSNFVKTGANKERPPSQEDWWYMRAASILRKIRISGPVGVQRLRTAFGSRKRRGHKPAHRRDSGGKVIRVILQQLEESDLIKKTNKPKKGRIVTSKGQSLIDRLRK